MTTSQIPAVTDYLVAQATAALPDVIVFDGPNLTTDTLAEPLHLWIGYDAKSSSADEAGAEATQAFATAFDQGRNRDEDGEIVCTADAWGGGKTLKTYRDQAAGIVAGVELLLRGLPQTGGPGDASMGGLCLWSGVAGPFAWYPRQTQNGAGMGVTFRVTYRARLTTS